MLFPGKLVVRKNTQYTFFSLYTTYGCVERWLEVCFFGGGTYSIDNPFFAPACLSSFQNLEGLDGVDVDGKSSNRNSSSPSKAGGRVVRTPSGGVPLSSITKGLFSGGRRGRRNESASYCSCLGQRRIETGSICLSEKEGGGKNTIYIYIHIPCVDLPPV